MGLVLVFVRTGSDRERVVSIAVARASPGCGHALASVCGDDAGGAERSVSRSQ
jgi:hypothetical protein